MSEDWIERFMRCFRSEEARLFAGVALDAERRGRHHFASGYWVSAYNIEKEHREKIEGGEYTW